MKANATNHLMLQILMFFLEDALSWEGECLQIIKNVVLPMINYDKKSMIYSKKILINLGIDWLRELHPRFNPVIYRMIEQ